MTEYKLTYFNITALGEPIRYLFAYGDIKYEDIRIEREMFPALKPSLPLGQVPVLDIDGKSLSQSIAIARYLARKVGLYGKNDFESLQIDEAVYQVNDFRAKIHAVSNEDNAEVKVQKLAKAKEIEIPFHLERLNKFATENGYLVNGKLSLADIYFAGIINYLSYRIGFNLIENYLNLQKLVHNVENEPKIKKYIENRPVTEF